jgi:hypothetical protein
VTETAERPVPALDERPPAPLAVPAPEPAATPRPLPGPDADTILMVLGCAVAVGVSLWWTRGIWHEGIPSGGDTVAHLVRTQFALDDLFARHQLDGWQPVIGLGYQQFLFMGPTFALCVALVKALSFGTLSTLAAFKVVIVAAFCLLPLSVAALARAFGLRRRGAGVAALLALTVNLGTGGIGTATLFGEGLVVNHFGSPLAFATLAGIVWLMRGVTPRRVVLTGLSFGLLVMTHGLAAMIMVLLAVAVAVGAVLEWALRNRPTVTEARRQLRPARPGEHDDLPDPLLFPVTVRVLALAGAGLLALGLGAFVWVPILMHGELRGPLTAFGEVPLFSDALPGVWNGTYILRPGVALFVLAGIVAMLVRWRRRPPLALAMTLAPFVFLLMARYYVSHFEGPVALQLGVRAYGYVAVVAVLPLAAVLGTPWTSPGRLLALFGLHRLVRSETWRDVTATLAPVAPLLVALGLVVLPPESPEELVRTWQPTPAVAAAADVIREVVPPQARFAVQAIGGELTGVGNAAFWISATTGRRGLNIFNVESSTVADLVYTADDLTSETPEVKAGRLARAGVTHLLVIDTATVPDLVTADRYFTPIWRQDTMAILQVRPSEEVPDPAALVAFPGGAQGSRARVTDMDSQHADVEIDSTRATAVSLAVAWSTKWHVTVNGTEVPPRRTDEGLLRVGVPAGVSRVAIAYGDDRWDLLGRAVSLLTLLGIGLAAAARARGWRVPGRRPGRDRDEAPGGGSPPPGASPHAPSGRHLADAPTGSSTVARRSLGAGDPPRD